MKSLAFIFDSLENLTQQTMLLEACGWDEDRANSLFEKASEVMIEIFNSASCKSWEDFKYRIGESLSEDFNTDEVITMLKIVDGIAEKSQFIPDSSYEN